MNRDAFVVDRGLSNKQAESLSRELAGRGVPVELRLSPLAGWDVWVYGPSGELAGHGIKADDAPAGLDARAD